MYTIQNLPIITPTLGRPVKYPFAELAIYESFVVPAADVDFKHLRDYASRTGRVMGKRFRAVKLADGSIQVTRLELKGATTDYVAINEAALFGKPNK